MSQISSSGSFQNFKLDSARWPKFLLSSESFSMTLISIGLITSVLPTFSTRHFLCRNCFLSFAGMVIWPFGEMFRMYDIIAWVRM